MERFFEWLGAFLFKGWEGIHPMGFNKNEEDEGLWFFNFTSPAWSLFAPHYQDINYLNIYDHLPEKVRTKNSQYYQSTLQRIQYAQGRKRTFLMKSVMSSGRIQEILKLYPDARFIYIHRDPKKTVPSYISMFSAPWSMIAPKATINMYREIGQTSIDFYNHFYEARRAQIDQQHLIELGYKDLIREPMLHIQETYKCFGYDLSDEVRERMLATLAKKRKYKSKHSYTLEQYGWSEEEIENSIQV